LVLRDNAVVGSVGDGTDIEILNGKKWKTWFELANAMFDYVEIV
jgi:hypothetical protein